MAEDTAITDSKYRLFIERAAASKLVWALNSKGGWANSHSSDSEEITVVPFWSDRALAKICSKDEWKGFLPVEIPLKDFLEDWCMGMADDGTLVGINWDANMFGDERGALNVALDILNQLSAINSAITFKNYSSIAEFIEEVKESLE